MIPQKAIVLERFDRVRTAEGWRRVHQEDLCQALRVHPSRKYQNEGGPGPRAIVNLLRDHSTAPNADVATFADALALNWLIASTDAHAKNFGVLIASQRVRLAPLYDVASVLPYPRITEMAVAIADIARTIGAELTQAELDDPIIDRLIARLTGRAQLCLKRIGQ